MVSLSFKISFKLNFKVGFKLSFKLIFKLSFEFSLKLSFEFSLKLSFKFFMLNFFPFVVVKMTVMVKNMSDFGKVNEVYKQFFTAPYPARSCFEVAALPRGMLVEVEGIALL